MSNRPRRVLPRRQGALLRATDHGLEQRPAPVADDPTPRAGGVAGIAQVEPGDTHAAALRSGEQTAQWNSAAGALRPESARVEALDCVSGLAVRLLTGTIVEVVREIGRDDDQRLAPGPECVEQCRHRLEWRIVGDDRYQGKF